MRIGCDVGVSIWDNFEKLWYELICNDNGDKY